MKSITISVFSLIVLISGCAQYGSNFFISNYENKPVSVRYAYLEKGYYSDSAYFDISPKNYVMIADTLLSLKVMRKYPFSNTTSYFDTLTVDTTDLLNYKLEIPKRNTVFIAPVHNYGGSVDYLILNNLDAIHFKGDYPMIENEGLLESGFVTYNSRILGRSYYIVNVDLKEMEEILRD